MASLQQEAAVQLLNAQCQISDMGAGHPVAHRTLIPDTVGFPKAIFSAKENQIWGAT